MESKVVFKSFSSGSAGNCYYLGIDQDGRHEGILIDAGVSLRRVKKELGAEGIGLDAFDAVLVTHDHMDHIRSLGSFCKHLGRPVWATKELHGALSRHILTHEYIAGCRRILEPDKWTPTAGGLIYVRYFIVPHDATQTVGFAIKIGSHRYVHITDCGEMTREATEFCAQADTVVLESNYDTQMLLTGPYPQELKERILNGKGHLSNDECAKAIEEFMHPGLRNLFLCHLSENNNTPKLAYESARSAIKEDINIRLQTLPRTSPSPLIIL